jgi:hypothetical protein
MLILYSLFDFMFPLLVIYGIWHSKSISFTLLMLISLLFVVYISYGTFTPSLGGLVAGGTRCAPTAITVAAILLWRVVEFKRPECLELIFKFAFMLALIVAPACIMVARDNSHVVQSINWGWVVIIALYSSMINPAFAYWLISTENFNGKTRLSQKS